MKKLFLYMMLAAVSFSMQSCLHDNDEIFEKSAAERIDEAVANAKSLLLSADNGWKFEYYLGSEYSYGGYNYIVKFGNDGKAHVSGEIADADMVTSSSWDVVKDQGPVLTFNTYNAIMHELSQPMQDPVDGYEGDYEFIIMRTTNDSIYLKGKKWGNEMLLTRMPSDQSWVDYLTSLADLKERIFFNFEGKYGSIDATAEIGESDNWLYVSLPDSTVEVPFIYTVNGLKLQTPVEIEGKQVQKLIYDDASQTLASEDGLFKMAALLPEGWRPFDFFAGKYDFTYNYGTFPVELVPDKANNRYLMKGLSDKYDIVMTYSRSSGRLNVNAQLLGTDDNGVQVWLAAWDIAGGGNLTWSTDAGVSLVWNGDETNPVFTFEDLGTYPGIITDSFILWGTVNGSSNGAYEGADWYAKGSTSFRIPYWKSLKKTGN